MKSGAIWSFNLKLKKNHNFCSTKGKDNKSPFKKTAAFYTNTKYNSEMQWCRHSRPVNLAHKRYTNKDRIFILSSSSFWIISSQYLLI